MSGVRGFSAAFVCLIVAGAILALQGRALSVTTGACLASAAFSAAAIALAVVVIRRR